MPMEQAIIHLENLPESGELFPAPIGTDPWVAFHGTSSVFAPSIERRGMRQEFALVTREELAAVIDVYRRMMWSGTDTGGFAVLKSWSHDHDFRHGESAFYFHADSLRVLTYALRDFAGGEKARALRRAIEDLHRYLKEPRIREKHATDIKRSVDPSIRAIPAGERERVFSTLAPLAREELQRKLNWTPIDLDELRTRVESLASVYARCAEVYKLHTYGIVYAVRFEPSDISRMRYCSTMGIQAFGSIAPDRLVGSAILTVEHEERWRPRIGLMRSKRSRADDPPFGLLAALEARQVKE